MNNERILLIQLFSNGDCLYVTAIARQIKHDFPDSHLTWVVSSKCKSMLINNPDVDVIEEVLISDASQNEVVFHQVIAETEKKKRDGIYTNVIVPQLLGSNMKYYDGIVCSSLFRSSGLKITVDPTPGLYLTNQESEKANRFALQHQLSKYEHVILFECAPQTKQLLLTDEMILAYSKQIVSKGNACVILSAPKAYHFNEEHIIDGNILSIRETVSLTHHCTLLLGCSSGISWAATSNAAKPLPFVQILASDAYYFNPLSITFKKWNHSLDCLIELVRFDTLKIGQVFEDVFSKGFDSARKIHHQKVKIQYKLHRGVIHQFLKQGEFSEIITFVKINITENGLNPGLIKYMFLGFILFPFQLLVDKIKRH
jgi:ADP-heptose:LPS heptosyltransferase